VPRKLLEKIGNETLLERGLKYMTSLREMTGAVLILAIYAHDKELVQAAAEYDINTVLVNPLGQDKWYSSEVPKEEFCEKISQLCDWVWNANILCCPFLNLETGLNIIESAKCAQNGMITVLKKRSLLYGDEIPAKYNRELTNTKTNPVYFIPAPPGEIWPVDQLLWTEELSALSTSPLEIKMSWPETIDIDTYADLEQARVVDFLRKKSCSAEIF